jgi:HSP20 family protein
MFSWPRWLEEFEEPTQKGLRIHETAKNIIAEAVVAGIPAKDVEVHIEDGVLTIKAEAKEEKKAKGAYQKTSRQYYYTAALSGGQWDKAKADIQDGIVKVTVPKAEAARPRRIEVKPRQS